MSDLTVPKPTIRQGIGVEIDAHFLNEVTAHLNEITLQLIEQAFRSTTKLLCRHSSRMEPPAVVKRTVDAAMQPFIEFGELQKNLVGFEPLISRAAKMIARRCRQHPVVAPHVHIILSSHDARTVARKTGQQSKVRISDYLHGANAADYLGIEVAEWHKEKLDTLNMQLAAQNLFAKIDVLRVARSSWLGGGEILWGWSVKSMEIPFVSLSVSDMSEDGPSPNAWPRDRRRHFSWDVAIGMHALKHPEVLDW